MNAPQAILPKQSGVNLNIKLPYLNLKRWEKILHLTSGANINLWPIIKHGHIRLGRIIFMNQVWQHLDVLIKHFKQAYFMVVHSKNLMGHVSLSDRVHSPW